MLLKKLALVFEVTTHLTLLDDAGWLLFYPMFEFVVELTIHPGHYNLYVVISSRIHCLVFINDIFVIDKPSLGVVLGVQLPE